MARPSSTSATRYAEAIFQVASEEGSYDLWLRELGEIDQLLSDRLAAQVLLGPVVPRERKQAILSQALPDLAPPVRRLLDLLTRRQRLDLLPQIADSFRRKVDEERGIEAVKVTTAVPIGDAERKLIMARLAARSGKQIRLEEAVDPDLLGGVVAQVGDEIIDGSVRGRLDRLRRALAGT